MIAGCHIGTRFNVPVGTILIWPAGAAPNGFMLCNGVARSRTTYASLFAVIGVTYGIGDGSTTFNLPDLRGYFIRGLDTIQIVDPDVRVLGSIQTDKFQGHKHSCTHNANTGAIDALAGTQTYGDNDAAPITVGNQTDDGVNGDPRRGTETRPVNIALNYVIKF